MFRIDASELTRVLRLLGRFTAKRATVPVLSCVHVSWAGNAIEWTATDLDGWLTVAVLREDCADSTGAACVPHRLLADLAGKIEGAVEFARDGEQVILRAGRATFRLNTVPAEQYPERPGAGQKLVTVAAKVLSQALRRVAPCCVADYSRPALTAVCWDGEAMVATDGTRLAVYEGVPAAGRTLLLGGQAMRAMAAMLPESGEVHVFRGMDDRSGLVSFCWTDGDCEYRVVTRQVAAAFPEWRNVLPAGEPLLCAGVRRADLVDALGRIAALAGQMPAVAMEYGDGSLVLRAASDAGRGEEHLECSTVGAGLTVRANADLVLDGLRSAESEMVEMASWGPETIQGIQEPGVGWRYYWLPLRGGD